MPASERRKAPRRRTPAAIEIVLSGPCGLTVRGRLDDASPYGLRLACASAREAARLPNACLRVTHCPEPLEKLLLERECVVVWTAGAAVGAEFRPPLAVGIEGLAEQLDFVSL